jgi:hypothetical protein
LSFDTKLIIIGVLVVIGEKEFIFSVHCIIVPKITFLLDFLRQGTMDLGGIFGFFGIANYVV